MSLKFLYFNNQHLYLALKLKSVPIVFDKIKLWIINLLIIKGFFKVDKLHGECFSSCKLKAKRYSYQKCLGMF